MKVFILLLSFIGAIAAALNVGSRIPPETVAMIIGVIMGALAAVPFSLVLGMLIGRRQQAPVYAPAYDAPPPFAPTQPPYPRTDGYTALRDIPPVVIVNPASFANQKSYAAAQLNALPMLGEARQFKIVGEEGQA